ncbi:glutamate synthase-related protein [Reinekea blandensis]|uniref:Putative glutamate synthetase n=1 Tax=Reinekea blandensis MED297 TaxID=314283 RepID=A4BD33_9GAMM|nr:glutamate synthase-related protein [Reinekea blandensis]EAR10115.1 putative glutamate synthetase [Reinekea sp. MED297] [Reinekea blandensis MED297]
MSEPIIANNRPAKVSLTEGEEYWFCACGRSQNQPFCDGSHKGTGFKPIGFTAEETGDAYLCQCKQSADKPFCDGTHKNFSNDQVGQPAPVSTDTAADKSPSAEPTAEEPTVAWIHDLAKQGLAGMGSHGAMTAMGVPRQQLPDWNDIQIMTAQLATQPQLDDVDVASELIIGPNARKPLKLSMPLLVSDMSFGALSEEAKTAMARGADQAGTGICSGEGGMLPEEQAENRRYFYEYASAGFGYSDDKLDKVQAFHFKGGQGAKTGTGGHLPANKVTDKIAEVRGLKAGEDAISPATFKDLHTPQDFHAFADRVRERTGGIPIGFKLSANHIEKDIQFALDASADYLILDGRGGGTGAAPELFRDHISVPTIPALARARRYLDQQGASGRVTLIITGGLRTPADFVKALALGADGIAVANSAMQAIGCVAARMCNTNNCPAGIATQKPELRKRLDVASSAERLSTFLTSSNELMKVMARACGHTELSQLTRDDLATWKRDMAQLSGVAYAGYERLSFD